MNDDLVNLMVTLNALMEKWELRVREQLSSSINDPDSTSQRLKEKEATCYATAAHELQSAINEFLDRRQSKV